MGAGSKLALFALSLVAFGLLLYWLDLGLTGVILEATGLAGAVSAWAAGLFVIGILFLFIAGAVAVIGSE